MTNFAGHRDPFSPEESLGSTWQQILLYLLLFWRGVKQDPALHTHLAPSAPHHSARAAAAPVHTGDVTAPSGWVPGPSFLQVSPLPLILPAPHPQLEEEPFPVSQEHREGAAPERARCELRAGAANGLMMTGRGLASLTAAWQPGTDWICALHIFWEHAAFLCWRGSSPS